MQRVFLLLQTFYFNKFSSYIATEELRLAALRVWDTSLKDISNTTIKQALDSLPDSFPSWPPTPGEFKELCISFGGSGKYKWSHELKVLDNKKEKVKNSNPSVERMIDEGSKVCKILKEIYPHLNWYQIADVFTKLKKICRVYYHKMNDLELIKMLIGYSKDELKHTLGLEQSS